MEVRTGQVSVLHPHFFLNIWDYILDGTGMKIKD